MSFQFNFLNETDDVVSEYSHTDDVRSTETVSSSPPAKQTFMETRHRDVVNSCLLGGQFSRVTFTSQSKTQVRINYIDNTTVDKLVQDLQSTDSPLLKSYHQASDLLSGEYEGGLKIWECALDLVNYLNTKDYNLSGIKVLELGCGAGLPGIYCLINGASVDFQDFNEEVIDLVTIPNVLLNSHLPDSHFYSGDWRNLIDMFKTIPEDERYDLILTSETIYDPKNYSALHAVLRHTLKRTGKILLAAKSYYFGVGGSTQGFETFLKSEGCFKSRIVHIHAEGVKRQILELEYA